MCYVGAGPRACPFCGESTTITDLQEDSKLQDDTVIPDIHLDILELHTDRLILRPIREEDAVYLFPLINDADVAATVFSMPHPYPEDMLVPWIKNSRSSMEDGDRYEMSLILKETGQPIGACALILSWEHLKAEIGYWLGKPYWGQGYMTEAAGSLMAFGFNELGLERIYAQCFATNPASARVLEKIGLKYEGCGRHERRKMGRFFDVLHFGLIRAEFFGEE